MSIKKLLIGAGILAITATSCSKILDVNPETDLDASTRFQNLEDYRFSLLGTYSLFRDPNYYGAVDGNSNAFGLLPDMLADDLIETAESLFNEFVFSSWTYTAREKQVEEAWRTAYKIINQANITLAGIDRFAEKDPDGVARIKGQALAIRAHVHFDMLRYWVNDFNRNSNSPGIPYITRFDYEQKPSRGTVKETYDKIEKDLQDALALLNSQDVNEGDERAYVDADVVKAMLARMYLYSNEPEKAIDYATEVIDQYPLASKNVFPQIWTDFSNDEVLWYIAFDAGQGTPGGNVYAPTQNRSQYGPNQDLIDQYDANDIRPASYYKVVTDGSGVDRTVFSKFMAKFTAQKRPDGVVNFKVFRVSEMYLIRAEANARLAAPDEAAANADLNNLRRARINGYTDETLSGQTLLDAIELERRKELIGEGHRFLDLKRKGTAARRVQRANCTERCVLAPTAPQWVWPIPQPEIDANPAIKPQNDGYGG